MSYIREDLKSMFDKGGIKYKFTEDKKHDCYLIHIETKKGNDKAIGIFVDNDSILFFVPRLKIIEKEKYGEIYKEINDKNCTEVYGSYFLLDESGSLCYRVDHSMEGENPINLEQIKTYLGSIGRVIDEFADSPKTKAKRSDKSNEKK